MRFTCLMHTFLGALIVLISIALLVLATLAETFDNHGA